jgi:hypothetical protein
MSLFAIYSPGPSLLKNNDMDRRWPSVKDFKGGFTQAFEDLTFTWLSVSRGIERNVRILLTERDSGTVMQSRKRGRIAVE